MLAVGEVTSLTFADSGRVLACSATARAKPFKQTLALWDCSNAATGQAFPLVTHSMDCPMAQVAPHSCCSAAVQLTFSHAHPRTHLCSHSRTPDRCCQKAPWALPSCPNYGRQAP